MFVESCYNAADRKRKRAAVDLHKKRNGVYIMKNKALSILLAAACVLAPAGCTAPDDAASLPLADGAGGQAAAQSLRAPEDISRPVSGSFDGQSVAMGYALVTDQDWGQIKNYSMFDDFRFVNGHAILSLDTDPAVEVYLRADGEIIRGDNGYAYCYPFASDGRALVKSLKGGWLYVDGTGKMVAAGAATDLDELDLRPVQHCEAAGENMYFYARSLGDFSRLGLMDQRGRQLTDLIYKNHGPFIDGLCYAILADGEHKNVLIDNIGTVQAVLPDDCIWARLDEEGPVICSFGQAESVYQQLYDRQGNRLSNGKYDSIGEFYGGLAIVTRNGKMGLIDAEGNLVIQPALAYDQTLYAEGDRAFHPIYMDEDCIVVPLGGKVAIVRIVRG